MRTAGHLSVRQRQADAEKKARARLEQRYDPRFNDKAYCCVDVHDVNHSVGIDDDFSRIIEGGCTDQYGLEPVSSATRVL